MCGMNKMRTLVGNVRRRNGRVTAKLDLMEREIVSGNFFDEMREMKEQKLEKGSRKKKTDEQKSSTKSSRTRLCDAWVSGWLRVCGRNRIQLSNFFFGFFGFRDLLFDLQYGQMGAFR